MKSFSKIIKSLSFLVILSVFLLTPAYAAMNDYCITPPFVVAGVNPNLLLIIDNSASMFDLTYLDKGSATREPTYCYDQTYNFSAHYTGYFQDPQNAINPSNPAWFVYYEYDFTNGYFEKSSYTQATFPSGCTKSIPGTLCVNIDASTTPKTVTKFVAEGNYLNWLTASKFDIQKQILTGGKYVQISEVDSASGVKGETRGCVGRRFIKEPITDLSFQEYTPPAANPNTGLGITFTVKGPDHQYSDTLLSPGGQTYLEIYEGDYNAGLCDTAIDLIIDGANANAITTAIEECLNYSDKDTCSLDTTIPCKDDGDCEGDAGTGTCAIAPHDGVCALNSDGVCSITTAGVCTPDNGTCTSKICVGGGLDGKACKNNKDCAYSDCTAGRIGSICSVNADCNVKTCTNAGFTFGNSCVVAAECNTGACSAPAVNVGNACTSNIQCDSGLNSCSAGQVGKACTTNVECNTDYAGICQKPVTQQIKSTFGQGIHQCTQYWDTGSFLGTDYLNIVKNPSGCSQIYLEYMTCSGGSRDGKQCYTLGATPDCPSGTCVNGPEAIRQGSPALLCSPKFAGYCAGSTDNWVTTDWYKREFANADACITKKYEEFCTEAQAPPVTDPSDDPSTTENFDNLPAIIGDMSIGSQLGDPLLYAGCTEKCALNVNLKLATPPSGVIQEFKDLIHFGVMRFNYYGTSSECPANMSCETICQTAGTTCMVSADCPGGEPCVVASNLDGSRLIDYGIAPGDPDHMEGYILGRCSSTTTTRCTSPTHCPAGEACLYSIGNHSTGLIKAIDDIFASTWTPFSEGFYNAIGYFAQRTDTRLSNPDFITEGEDSDAREPIQYVCQKNNILLITDGMSTADLNPNVTSLVSSYNDGDGQTDSSASATCPEYAGSRNLDDLAWLAKHRNINDFDETPATTDPEINSKTITTYVVFNGVPSTDPGECNPDALLSETAENGCGTQTGCYQRAEDPAALRQALREAFLLIAGKAASGTAASVLASGEGTGANLVQAIFYPERAFGANEILWSGSMKNLWYSIDPFLGSSTIREDTNNDKILNLKDDYIVNFFFDPLDNLTKANLYSDATNGDGVKDTPSTPVATPYFENVKSLWESGLRLWATLPVNRTIYTTTDESTRADFTIASLGAHPELITLLQSPSAAAAAKLIGYARGNDVTTKFCSNSFGTSCTSNSDCTAPGTCIAKFCSSTVGTKCATDTDCPGGETCRDEYRSRTVTIGATSGVWKLGDIVNSTPRIASWVPLNFYYKTYLDRSYKAFTESSTYTDRGMVFVGANDGMLHAFKLGYLKLFEEKFKKAQLCDSDTCVSSSAIGREEWAFIPKNALPYLQYMAEPSYCHLYYADLTPYIFDASIGGLATADRASDGSSWRTILIGGMRQGGACKDAASSLGVQVPAANQGYSSYFALDITNLNDPQVLWEFSNADITDAAGTGKLGFATSGPAVVRIDDPGDTSHKRNGHWFVVFGSGPTGPIETNTHQFKAYSDQHLKLFVLDLATGALETEIDTGIPYAFSGSMLQAAIDFDQNDTTKPGFYSDDALYFGFTRAENNPPVATTQWNVGGVLRLLTKNNPDPDNWALSTVIGCDGAISVDNCIGPVTAGISKLQNYKDETVRLYFGTGRFFYRIADAIDDADIGRRIYGVKEQCYSQSNDPYLDTDCTTKVTWNELTEAADETGTTDAEGWYINLDSSAGTLKAERMVTDPLATSIGAVFFTTTKPSSDVCEFGGASHLWAVDYDTGGEVSSSVLRGKALLQVSTGSIEEVSLKTAFTERDGRRTPSFQGVPPAGAPPGILIPPQPMDKILHIREQ
jgi:type IV pilus assembly protein PilY1